MRLPLLLLTLMLALSLQVNAASLDDFAPRVQDLNVTARADLPGFKATLSTDFGIPVPRIDKLMVSLGSPADAYFCLKLGQLSGRPFDEVSREFQAHRGQGWGVVAKNLGIKPGSAAFHELKDTAKIKEKSKHRNKQQKKEKEKSEKNKGKNK